MKLVIFWVMISAISVLTLDHGSRFKRMLKTRPKNVGAVVNSVVASVGNKFFGGPNDPSTPRPWTLTTPLPVLNLDDDDSSTDSEATNSEDDNWMLDENFPTDEELCRPLPHGDPQNVIPYSPTLNRQTCCSMFPNGALPTESHNIILPYHPNSQYISDFECTEENRLELVNSFFVVETDRENLGNELYSEFERFTDAKKLYKTIRHSHRPTSAIIRRLRRHENRIRNYRLRMQNLILQQEEMMMFVRAYVNGIAYRAAHPHHSFVIFIQRTNLILQRCRPVIRFNHFWWRLTTTTSSPQTHDRHPRNTPQTITYQNETYDKLPVVVVSTVQDFLLQSVGTWKIIVIPTMNDPVEFAVLKLSLHEIFSMYELTVKSFYYTTFYLNLIQEMNYHMNFFEKLLVKNVANFDDKTLAILKIKSILKLQMNEKYHWWKNPEESLKIVTKLISNQVDQLVGNSLSEPAATNLNTEFK